MKTKEQFRAMIEQRRTATIDRMPTMREGELRSYARLGDGFESEAALEEMARRGLSEVEEVMRVMNEAVKA